MAQLLKVIQDPSIVDNVPTTALEQLQLATERKAAEMAAAQTGGLTSHSVKAVSVAPDGTPITTTPQRQPTTAELQAIRTVANALQTPITHTAIATQERLTGTPSPKMSFFGDEDTGVPANPALAAIDGNIMVPMPRKRPPSPRDSFLSGDPGETDWSIANQGGAGLGGPLKARSVIPANTYRRPVMAAPVRAAAPVVMTPRIAPTDPLQLAVLAAQRNGETYDRSRDPSFNPNGGAHGGSLAGF